MSNKVRATRRIVSDMLPHTIEVGTVVRVTPNGADIRLANSGRYLTDCPSIRGSALEQGDHVVLIRTGIEKRWIILGAMSDFSRGQPGGSGTTLVPMPSLIVATGRDDHIEVIWTAHKEETVIAYELQHNSTESASGATTVVVRGNQFDYYAVAGTLRYFRARTVGEGYVRSGWTSWTSAAVAGVTFLSLLDTPASYTGHACKIPMVDVGEACLIWADISDIGGACDFLGLADTPDSYTGQACKVPVVKGTEDGLEFRALSFNPGATSKVLQTSGTGLLQLDKLQVAGNIGLNYPNSHAIYSTNPSPSYFAASLGVGTTTPGKGLLGSPDLDGRTLHIKDTTDEANLVAEGYKAGRLYLIDSDADSNERAFEISSDDGRVYFRAVYDADLSERHRLMTFDLETGTAGFGTYASTYKNFFYHALDSVPNYTEVLFGTQQIMTGCTISVGSQVPMDFRLYDLADASTVWNANTQLYCSLSRFRLYNQLTGTGTIKRLIVHQGEVYAYETSSGTYTDVFIFASYGASYRHASSTVAITNLMHYYAYGSGGLGVTNQYGVYVGDMTGATYNYGVYIAGADTYAIWVDSGDSRFDGNLVIGNASPSALMTLGLTIDQAGNDNEIQAWQDSTDVGHGCTTIADTDTFGCVRKDSADSGGLQFRGLSEGQRAYRVIGYYSSDATAKDATALSAVMWGAIKISGTGVTSVATDQNCHGWQAYVSGAWRNLMILDAEGTLHLDDTTGADAWDEWNDAELAFALSRWWAGTWNHMMRYGEEDFERARLITRYTNPDGSPGRFLNMKNLVKFLFAAVSNLYQAA